MFHHAHQVLDVTMGTINTIVLITSSVTMALAIRSMQLGSERADDVESGADAGVCRRSFLVIKYFEYAHKFHLGQLPGKYYTFHGIEGTNPHIFFSIYFSMTGLHGIHVIGGMIVIGMMLYGRNRNEFIAGVLYADRDDRPVLALGGLDLDIPVPASLPGVLRKAKRCLRIKQPATRIIISHR